MADPSYLRIPPPLRASLKELALLSDDGYGALADAVQDFEGTHPEELSKHLIARLGLAESEAVEVVRLVFSFESLRQLNDWTPQEAALAVAHAEDVPVESDGDRTKLATRIEGLLGLPAVASSARLMDAQYENNQTFRAARFLTDARTVFDEDAEVASSVIITTLAVSYAASDGRTKTAYYALDDSDLADLAKEIDVARRRSAALRDRLLKAGIQVAPTSTEEGTDVKA